jgi:two-component system NarL family sensor kinase
MHRRLIFATALVWQLASVQAQIQVGLNTDSLKQVLFTLPSDTNRVNLMITLGRQYEDNNPDNSLYYYSRAGKLSEQLNYTVGIIKYISNYAAVLNAQGKREEAIRLNLRAATISEQHGLKRYAGKAYHDLGDAYQYQENYPMAVQYYVKALPLVEQYADRQSSFLLFTSLCDVYRHMDQAEKALEYARRALAIGDEENDSYLQVKALIHIGNCFKDLGKYEQALSSYEKARSLAMNVQDVNALETILVHLGNVYVELNQPDVYLPLFYEALPLADSIQDVSGKSAALLGICEGLYQRQQWDAAVEQLRLAIEFTSANNQKEVLRKLYLILSDVLIATHRFEEARTFRLKHDSVALLVMKEVVVREVQAWEDRYRFEQHQNTLLQKNIQLQKTESENASSQSGLVLLLVGILFFIAILIFVYLYYRQRQAVHQQTLLTLESEKKAVRLQSLADGERQERIRISQEVHDDMGSGLKSMLFLSRSIVSTSPSDKHVTEELTAMATSLIEKMNEIVWAMRSDPEPVEDFVTYLRSMIGEMLGNAGIEFKLEVKGETPSMILPSEYRHHVYLIVKEAVHNIIRHSKATLATLTLDFQSAWKIEIADNGIGFPEGTSNGNGLKNMRRRVTLLHGRILVQHKEGTYIQVNFPSPV